MQKYIFDDKELIDLLKERIPEIKQFIYPEMEFSAFIHFGSFGGFLRDQIMNDENNNELIEKSFGFLNNLFENGDERIKRMLRVETFEILTDFPKTIDVSKLYLTGQALESFIEVIKLIKQ